jgi:type III secretory pathway component EscS
MTAAVLVVAVPAVACAALAGLVIGLAVRGVRAVAGLA